MRFFIALEFATLAAATLSHRQPFTNSTNKIKCPLIFDGRIPSNLTLSSFDDASTSPYNPGFVKGENRTWSSILLLPNISASPSRFDSSSLHKPIEVTIDSASLFRPGSRLQTGFRRAGLLLKDDANDVGADAADNGTVTFHWSIKQDLTRPLNLSHEYMNVWHEKADYSGNQFTFVGGVVLVGDGGNGVDTWEERESWKVQNGKNEFVFRTPILFGAWQNFGVQLDHGNNTIQVYYSAGNAPLEAVTGSLPNENAGGGQLQVGIAKKPTETQTVVWDGYQEPISERGEGQIYGSIFVEDSSNGCVSL
ncbi:glycoside hydrolase family 131 protein [Cucurbitaria berberidis CBS 394.84]|uniref:Glycoside hydrolase family 131 protein n=1 Tax=Cucurbitaria berberidis CBS 394.84 TaxID=1168544 RepID=A0A9P4L672_9PLEO|nr:glycoside hydrolase family 131 protein [Cucurbitaria berberidis CBS 394.84]KAF1842768.1 glycoside hydrolase family 131 protein [Cucurbitaria berberidis CBS 394.84]